MDRTFGRQESAPQQTETRAEASEPGVDRVELLESQAHLSDRDVGLVFGQIDDLEFQSDFYVGSGDGDEDIYHSYDLSVAPGETVTIVQFVIMTGTQTGESASSILDTADEVDDWAKRIVDGWGTDPTLQDGMTAEQIANVWNWGNE